MLIEWKLYDALGKKLKGLKSQKVFTHIRPIGLALFALIFLINLLGPAALATTTALIDTDTDFNNGTYSSTQVVGSGSAAVVNLAGGSNWWNSSYQYRRALTIDITGDSSLSSGYAVNATLSGSDASAIAGSTLTNGNDFRVVYWNGTTSTEIDRYLASYTSSSISFYFKTQASLSANDTTHYAIYYDNSSAGSPPANTSNIFSTTGIETTAAATGTDVYSQTPITYINDGIANGSSPGTGNNNGNNSRYMLKLPAARKIWKVSQYWGGNDLGGWAKPNGQYFPASYQLQYSTSGSAVVTDATGTWVGLSTTTDNLMASRVNTTDYTPTYAGSPTVSGTVTTTNSGNCSNCFGTSFNNTFNPTSMLSLRIAYTNVGWLGPLGELYIYPVNATDATVEPTVTAGTQENDLAASGTWTSSASANVVALTSPGLWGNGTSGSTAFSAVIANASSTATIDFQIRIAADTGSLASASYVDLGTANSGTSFVKTKADLDGLGLVASNAKYAQIKAIFAQTSGTSPTLDSLSLVYVSDPTAPSTNASSVQLAKSNGGASVSSNGWVSADPYASWTAGTDNAGGTGIKGYCVYVGQDSTGNPVSTKGYLGSSPIDSGGACQYVSPSANIDLSASGVLGAALASSISPYYINVKAIDYSNNVYSGSSAQFQFRFDNTPPTNPSFITAPSQFVSNKAVSLTWPTSGGDATADANSGVAGLQYRIGSSGTWYGDSHNGAQDSTDLLSNDGSYTMQSSPDFANLAEGNNIIYFRTWDAAGNVSLANITTVIKINTASPSSPQNVTATPSTNTTNSFAFSWLTPASFTGSASNITYCYTINTLPSSSNCTYTAAGVTSLPAGTFATQPGDNTFYVVAKDEAGNINYATAASTTFTANTSAPGVPLNIDVADISVKATNNWKLAISWEAPTDVGAGVDSYKVYRSTDNASFSPVASTSGTSYVDSGLSQTTYYYKVKACDSANNCGVFTGVVSALPTGKFTSSANVLSGPDVSNLSTKKATITWVTDRTSDSKVAFGTAIGSYSADEIANSTQTVSHTINLVNLTPGTTYYYVAKWTDEDGNTGTSPESTFTTLPAPSISNVNVTNVNLSSATIEFTSTSADSVKIYYGKSKDFGAVQNDNTSTSESTYSVQLNGLDDGSQYFYKINPFDTDGNEYDQTVLSFTTPARPHITNLRFQPVADQPTSTQQITWDTNVPSSSELDYGPAGQAPLTVADAKLTTTHSMTISGLIDNTQYNLTAQSRDSAGNLAVSDKQVFHTALDTRPPKISGVKVVASIKGTGAEAYGQMVVSWTTDEPSTSQVAYGEGSSGNYANSSAEDASLVLDHVVIISNLPTSRIFQLQALSKDASNNLARSHNYSAIVGDASDNVLSIVFNALQKVFGF